MIVEVTSGSDFAGLKRYLVEGRDHRLLMTQSVSSLATAVDEMAAVAGERPTVRTPVLHVSVSFALEDTDQVTDELALEVIRAILKELTLDSHQVIAVWHLDTPHCHFHLSINKVHPETFETPPDRPNRALTDPAFERKKGRRLPPRHLSWDSFILPRLAAVCDRIARSHGLRRVKEVLAAPGAGEKRKPRLPPQSINRREERTGQRSIFARETEIRSALNETTWEFRNASLRKLGVVIEPAMQSLRDGSQRIRGIRLRCVGDEKNRISASALGSDFGLGALERKRDPASPSFEDWWEDEQRARARNCGEAIAADIRGHDERERLFARYRTYESEHLETRRLADMERARLKGLHKAERIAATKAVAAARAEYLRSHPRSEWREHRVAFALVVAAPLRSEMSARQKNELKALRAPRKMTWAMWLRSEADLGDLQAAKVLREMRRRHRRQGYIPKAQTIEKQKGHSRGQAANSRALDEAADVKEEPVKEDHSKNTPSRSEMEEVARELQTAFLTDMRGTGR